MVADSTPVANSCVGWRNSFSSSSTCVFFEALPPLGLSDQGTVERARADYAVLKAQNSRVRASEVWDSRCSGLSGF